MNIPNEVATLIQNSGNNFHAKVARWFIDNDWHIVVSPYYMDQSQNKAREIDLIAEKPWPVTDILGQTIGYVAVRLFVECKFIPSYSVFWFADKDMKSAKELVLSSGSFSENLMGINIGNHHYLERESKVAKLFSTSANKNHENDLFYKALNQSISAMVSMRSCLYRFQRFSIMIILWRLFHFPLSYAALLIKCIQLTSIKNHNPNR